MSPITANLILIATWLSLAVAVVAHAPAGGSNARSLGHHAHAQLTDLSHLPVVAASVDDATGKIETTAEKKRKRAFGKRYYGDDRGFSRPSALPAKRDNILPAGWASTGCVTEGNSFRALRQFAYVSSTMTINSCLEVCRGQNYTIAGLEWSDECYCANEYTGGGGAQTDDSSCSYPCAGSPSDICGGYYVLSSYQYTAPNSTTAITTGQCDALSEQVSSVVASASAALASASAVASSAISASATLASAAAASSAVNLNMAVSQSGFASSVVAASTAAASASGPGNYSTLMPSSTVSGSVALPTGASSTSTEWESLGCYLDNPAKNNGANILTGSKLLRSTSMTAESCQTRCAGQGYNFAGVEYGNECWCGDLTTAELSALKSNAPWCNAPCSGDPTQTCGGNWSLQLYEQVDVSDAVDC